MNKLLIIFIAFNIANPIFGATSSASSTTLQVHVSKTYKVRCTPEEVIINEELQTINPIVTISSELFDMSPMLQTNYTWVQEHNKNDTFEIDLSTVNKQCLMLLNDLSKTTTECFIDILNLKLGTATTLDEKILIFSDLLNLTDYLLIDIASELSAIVINKLFIFFNELSFEKQSTILNNMLNPNIRDLFLKIYLFFENLKSGRLKYEVIQIIEGEEFVALSSNHKFFITRKNDHVNRLFGKQHPDIYIIRDIISGNILHRFDPLENIKRAIISNDSTLIITASYQLIKIWDTNTWEQKGMFTATSGRIHLINISEDNHILSIITSYLDKCLFSTDNERRYKSIETWNLKSGHHKFITSDLIDPAKINPIAFSAKNITHNGQFIIVALKNIVQIWQAETGELIKTFSVGEEEFNHVGCIEISPDDSFFTVWDHSAHSGYSAVKNCTDVKIYNIPQFELLYILPAPLQYPWEQSRYTIRNRYCYTSELLFYDAIEKETLLYTLPTEVPIDTLCLNRRNAYISSNYQFLILHRDDFPCGYHVSPNTITVILKLKVSNCHNNTTDQKTKRLTTRIYLDK